MAVAENGQLVEDTKPPANGDVNLNASTITSPNPSTGISDTDGTVDDKAQVALSATTPPPATSWTRWLVFTTTRLALWYAVLTVLFRCPSDPSQLNESSPQICKPYFSLKSQVQPHVQPYYDNYASPYVEKARPYVEQANARVLEPATAIAKKTFDSYAAPHLDTARAYGQQQWEAAVRPQLEQAQAQAADLYNQHLGPHVSKASEIAQPYYSAAQDTAEHVHKNHLLPAYHVSRPYLDSAANSSHHFVFNQAPPLLRQGWNNALVYVNDTLWPLIKGLYIDNVYPQLVIISEKIAEYQENRKLGAANHDDDDAAAAAADPVAGAASGAAGSASLASDESESSSIASSSTASSVAPSSSVKPAEKEVVYATDESTTEDLRKWQDKFAVAADKGTDDLQERISEITTALTRSEIENKGRLWAAALQLIAAREINNIQTKIKSTAASLPEHPSSKEVASAEDDIGKAVRASGLAIREKALKVREWAKDFETLLDQHIATATATTLDVLDSIRDIGLQEVGMRWAWSEGVTYKHWAKYHELKNTLDAWRREVQDSALENKDAVAAKATAQQILGETMAHTEDAAKELIKLKEAARWKLRARDSSDDFEPREIPVEDVQEPEAATEAATEAVTEAADKTATESSDEAAAETVAEEAHEETVKAADTIAEESQESNAAVETATEGSDRTATEASDKSATQAVGETAAEVAGENATGAVVETAAESHVEKATGATAETAEAADETATESAHETATEPAAETASDESEVNTAEATPEAASETATEPADETATGASKETATESADETATEASPLPKSSHKSYIIPGAEAQEVKGTTPILDDKFDDNSEQAYSDAVKSLVEDTGDLYAEVTKAASEALFGTHPGADGASATSVASEKYSSALAAASSVLLDPARSGGDASAQYTKAVAAASHAAYGAIISTFESLVSQASASYSAAVSLAEQHYHDAKSIASAQVSDPAEPIHGQIFSSIESAFSGAKAAASSRLQAALSTASASSSTSPPAAAAAVAAATSSASGITTGQATATQGPLEFISSLASSHLQAALEQASAHYSSVKSAVGVAAGATPAPEEYLGAAQQQYSAALNYAHAQYSDFVSLASHAVHETLGPAYSSASSAALDNWQSLVSAASNNVYLVSAASNKVYSPAAATPVAAAAKESATGKDEL